MKKANAVVWIIVVLIVVGGAVSITYMITKDKSSQTPTQAVTGQVVKEVISQQAYNPPATVYSPPTTVGISKEQAEQIANRYLTSIGSNPHSIITAVKKRADMWRVQVIATTKEFGTGGYFVCVNANTGEITDFDDDDYC